MRPNRGGLTRRGGFTLVEILVAIGIIAALVAMVFLGFRHVSASSRANRGKVSMENLRAMLTEYEHTGAPMKKLESVYADLTTTSGIIPMSFTPPKRPTKSCSVAESVGAERFGEGTIRTQRVLRRLVSVPDVKKMFDALPAESLLKVQYASGVTYFTGDEVIDADGNYYVCASDNTTTSPSGSGGGWTKLGGSGPPIHHTPVILDGFGNPIWFVPAAGLGVPNGGSVPPDGVDIGRSGNGSYTNPDQLIVAPGAKPNPAFPPKIGIRPFFASAGEDGDFAKGDDNLYSFQQ